MKLPSLLPRFIACATAILFLGLAARAAPPKLPKNAITDDTFFVATVDLSKVIPATLDATAKGMLGDNAGEVDDLLAKFKAHHEKYAKKGVQRVTVVVAGDPDKQEEPPAVYYVQFKPGADHGEVEDLIREEEADVSPDTLEYANDGDCLVLRKKNVELPKEGSEERAKLFAEAIGACDKPVVGAVVFNAPIIASANKNAQVGMPPAMGTIVKESKWIRLEVTLGEKAKCEMTVAGADEDAAKRLAEAVTTLGGILKAEVVALGVALKQGGGPPQTDMKVMADAMSTMAEALKPEQAGDRVKVTFDDKTVGSSFRAWLVGRRVEAQAGAAAKGGL